MWMKRGWTFFLPMCCYRHELLIAKLIDFRFGNNLATSSSFHRLPQFLNRTIVEFDFLSFSTSIHVFVPHKNEHRPHDSIRFVSIYSIKEPVDTWTSRTGDFDNIEWHKLLSSSFIYNGDKTKSMFNIFMLHILTRWQALVRQVQFQTALVNGNIRWTSLERWDIVHRYILHTHGSVS